MFRRRRGVLSLLSLIYVLWLLSYCVVLLLSVHLLAGGGGGVLVVFGVVVDVVCTRNVAQSQLQIQLYNIVKYIYCTLNSTGYIYVSLSIWGSRFSQIKNLGSCVWNFSD